MAKRIGKAVTYFLLTCIGYIYLEPIFQMISKAVMSPADVINPSIEWLAKSPTLNNFKAAAAVLKVPGSLINSIGFSALLALLQTFVAAMTGYGLSRFRFRGSRFLGKEFLVCDDPAGLYPAYGAADDSQDHYLHPGPAGNGDPVSGHAHSADPDGRIGAGGEQHHIDFDLLELL